MVVETYATVATPPPVAVSMLQARLAINAAGLRSKVDAALSAASQDVQDYWNLSPTIERSHPIVAQICAALGLTDAQMDQLFKAAANIKP